MTMMQQLAETTERTDADTAPRETMSAMLRGAQLKCPKCGTGQMFRAYLKVANNCPSCGEALHHQRADDAPPYFTMFIVCHIVVAGVLATEKIWAPSFLTHIAIWFPITIGMCLALLPIVKGSLIGLQWALRMHGFGTGPDPSDPQPEPTAADRG
jgi:uncharacterized protein (DUF983 family)